MPELASREHIKNLPIIVSQVMEEAGVSVEDLGAIAATRGPGLKGCLLVGLGYAKGLAYARKIPLICVNHLEAHIAASYLIPMDEQPTLPCLVLLVSGGHTSLVLWEESRRYRTIANTRDDAAGEAFDKVATLLGFPYPGGPALARAAGEWGTRDTRMSFPIGVANDVGSFSFSGFKTAVQRKVRELGELQSEVRLELAAAAQEAIVSALVSKAEAALADYDAASLLLTGGVAANLSLRQRLSVIAKRKGLSLSVPPAKWCTDNAAMVGACALQEYWQHRSSYEAWSEGSKRADLGPNVGSEVSALARWPLDGLR